MKLKMTIFLGVIFFGFFGLAGNSYAADYYVSPTGAATWANCGAPAKDGTEACSWQTAMANAAAGDTVYFRGGTYSPPSSGNSEIPRMNPANSGTSGNPITFKAYSNETPAISGNSAFGTYNRSYIIWDGFSADITGSTGPLFAVIISASSYITIRNCDLTGTQSADYQNKALISVQSTPRGSHIYIENNKLHDNTAPDGATGTNTGAIWVFNADDVYISNNDIYNTYRGVMWKVHENRVNVYKNFFHDITTAAIYPMTETDGDTGYFVYQNVAVNVGSFVSAPDASRPSYDLEVYNNTVYSTSLQGGLLGNMTYHRTRESKWWNNIFYSSSGSAQWLYFWNIADTGAAPGTGGYDTPSYCDYNDFYGSGNFSWNGSATYDLTSWRTTTGFDLSSNSSDPQFINAGGQNPEDYKLQSGSPARTGRGGSYASVMGAYITGNEQIGYSAPGRTLIADHFDLGADTTITSKDQLTTESGLGTWDSIAAANGIPIQINSSCGHSGRGAQFSIINPPENLPQWAVETNIVSNYRASIYYPDSLWLGFRLKSSLTGWGSSWTGTKLSRFYIGDKSFIPGFTDGKLVVAGGGGNVFSDTQWSGFDWAIPDTGWHSYLFHAVPASTPSGTDASYEIYFDGEKIHEHQNINYASSENNVIRFGGSAESDGVLNVLGNYSRNYSGGPWTICYDDFIAATSQSEVDAFWGSGQNDTTAPTAPSGLSVM